MPLRVGVHPNNLHLFLAARWEAEEGGAFAGLEPEFVPYPEGRDSALLLLEGRIDLCGTGSTPPILAQAAGLDVLYLAASATRPANGALLVRPDGSVPDLAALAGRRVALLDGSFHTYLLARALEGVGLGLKDVTRVELAPGASLRALEAGEVDAWVAMAPLLDPALASGRAALLAPCGETIPNRSVFWTLRRRGLSPARMDGALAALIRLGEAIAARPEEAARHLADAGASAADLAAWRKAVAGRDWTIHPAGPAIIAEQQAEADTLHRHGDLAAPLDLAAAARPTALA